MDLPTKLVKRMGEAIEFLGFGGEEELIEAAVRRLRDDYAVLIWVVARNR